MGRRHVSSTNKAVGFLLAILCGVFLGFWTRSLMVPCIGNGSTGSCCGGELSNLADVNQHPDVIVTEKRVGEKTEDVDKAKGNLLFVGIITAKKYINTRVRAVYETWAKHIPGKVVFFSSEGSIAPKANDDTGDDIPIVALPGVDDSYPPQKKSFLMLKYMHDRYGDRYNWFMRADDDVYVKGDRLVTFLNSLNSSKPLFIGQAGIGKKEELGQLSLDNAENYCMGGTGMLISQSALAKMVPHTSYCLQNLYTAHEDVEIGRCISKFAGVSCSWAFEMQSLFYQNHHEPNGSFSHNLKTHDVLTATTLHPIKNHTYQYRMHSFLQSQHLRELRHQELVLRREKREMDLLTGTIRQEEGHRMSLSPSLMKTVPSTRHEVLDWEYLTSKVIYSSETVNPKRAMESSQKQALEGVLLEVMQLINRNARQRGRTIDYKDILYGYRRVNPLHGADYVLDLLLVYKKHKGRRMTVPVRRHAYIQQTFTALQFREELEHTHSSAQSHSDTTTSTTATSSHILQKLSHDLYRVAWGANDDGAVTKHTPHNVITEVPKMSDQLDDIIHFILPLAGRYSTFQLFMNNFESVCLNGSHAQSVALVVMLFQSDTEDTIDLTKAYMSSLQSRHPGYDLRVVEMPGPFSRGIALQRGSDLYNDNSLMFFIDVDIYFDVSALQRIRANTRRGSQVYFPVVFSRYEPGTTCTTDICDVTDVEYVKSSAWQEQASYEDQYGYWRLFGFGISAMYRSDLNHVGGFDTDIRGWGKEDVNLYSQFVAHNVSIFRAVDPGLVHVYHPINCDTSLEDAQYQMCLGSRAATYGGSRHLAAVIYNTESLYNRGEDASDTAARPVVNAAASPAKSVHKRETVKKMLHNQKYVKYQPRASVHQVKAVENEPRDILDSEVADER